MANRTPLQWFLSEQVKSQQLAQNEAMDYLAAGPEVGAAWFLTQFDGLRSLVAYTLSAGGQMVVLSHTTNSGDVT